MRNVFLCVVIVCALLVSACRNTGVPASPSQTLGQTGVPIPIYKGGNYQAGAASGPVSLITVLYYYGRSDGPVNIGGSLSVTPTGGKFRIKVCSDSACEVPLSESTGANLVLDFQSSTAHLWFKAENLGEDSVSVTGTGIFLTPLK